MRCGRAELTRGGRAQDNEAVLEYLLQRGEAGRALAVLRRPGVSPELLYKFAPALVAAAPGATVDAWLAAQVKLYSLPRVG